MEIVESFTYLGSILDGKGGTEADVSTRIGKARTALANLSNVWKASKISISTKIRLFNSNVKSVLLYGCETWKTTQGVLNKLLLRFVSGTFYKYIQHSGLTCLTLIPCQTIDLTAGLFIRVVLIFEYKLHNKFSNVGFFVLF